MSSMITAQTPRYWRSLDELERSPQFQEFLHREFPVSASELPDGVSRRRWLQLMGASFALASVSGCRWETETIAPLSERPEGRIPGKPEHFAVNVHLAGRPYHLLATSYEGRPIKVEGNPDHPEGSRGADVFAQAATLSLYDPDRSVRPLQRVQGDLFSKEWADFEAWLRPVRRAWSQIAGKGVALLVEPRHSLAEAEALQRFQRQFPEARLYAYAPLGSENALAGAEMVCGQKLRTHYRIDQAEVVVCFDSDLFYEHPAATRLIGEFSTGRNPEEGAMKRLYAIESQFSVTGAAADHRLAVKSAHIGRHLRELTELVTARLAGDTSESSAPVDAALSPKYFLDVVAEDLVQHRGRALVAVGANQPPEVHAAAFHLNALLENLGTGVVLTEPLPQDGWGTIAELSEAIDARTVETLVILGGNPVYDAPGVLDFGKRLEWVPQTLRLGLYDDETSHRCQWSLPQTHPFEEWGDALGDRGTIGVCQPLIAPLTGGRSVLEFVTMLTQGAWGDAQALVREAIDTRLGRPLSDPEWQQLLHDGFLADSQLPSMRPQLAGDKSAASPAEDPSGTDDAAALELVFLASRSTYDGTFANNAWLQETPDPLTKLTWDNAALISPATADRLGVTHGDVVQIEADAKSFEIPAFVLPGQAENSIGVALGYGRTAAGSVGGELDADAGPVGVDVNPLRPASGGRFLESIGLTKVSGGYQFATTQDHHAIDQLGLEETGRRTGQLVREGTLEDYQTHPDFAQHMTHVPPEAPLWQQPTSDGRAWGMAIDLTRCIGCNACVTACQAENNVPVVGKDQVAVGREMHWIRIDRYFSGSPESPTVATQPLACQHCENAPCEQVCPVAATVHSAEGLNDMVYNRCIGTRYCANNCPYKVRRFNFFDYQAEYEEPNRELAQLVLNPEVTVRSRGVMEKCTYCVQRISATRIEARNDGRPIRDGEILTACQQACPAEAIEFGDLNQEGSRVAAAHSSPRAYAMLAELNVKPRTAYLARIRNQHPRLTTHEHASDSHTGEEAAHGHSH